MPTLIIRNGINTNINRNVNDNDTSKETQILLNRKSTQIENNATSIHANNSSSIFNVDENYITSNINEQIQKLNDGELSIIAKEKSNADSNSRSSTTVFPSNDTSKQNLNQIQNGKQSIVNEENYNKNTNTEKKNTAVVKIEDNIENKQSPLQGVQLKNEKLKGSVINLQQTKEQATRTVHFADKKLCKEEEMDIENEYESKNCCLLQQIQFVHNQVQSLRQQEEQTFDEQHSVGLNERKRKHMIDGTSMHIVEKAVKKRNDDGLNIWKRNYELLCKFYQREGHCNVPDRHVKDGIKLGVWLGEQRRLKRKGSLDTDRILHLNELDIGWDASREQLESNYQLPCKFNNQEGLYNVPTRHEEDGVNLVYWIDRHTKSKTNGSMYSYRMATEKWECNFKLLCSFYNREGHCNVPSHHMKDGFQLGRWLNRQKKLKQQGRLENIHVNELNKLGIVWDVSREQLDSNFQLLCKFYKREGHYNVPNRHVEDGFYLGNWLSTQRKLKKKGSLDSARIARLNELGIIWDVVRERWESTFQCLSTFYNREGHCNVLSGHVENGIQLGEWLKLQRKLKKKGKLDIKRVTKLNKLGIVWDVMREQWESKYQLLCKFYKREGHRIVPYYHMEDGIKLGCWVMAQKKSKRNGTMDSDRIARLDEHGIF